MTTPRALFLLAALARSAFAASAVESAAPLAALVERVPAIRAQASLQLSLLPAPAAAALPATVAALAAPAAAAGSAPAALEAGTALLTAALAARPGAELHELLGPENAVGLAKLSAAFAREEAERPDSATSRALSDLRSRWNPSSASGSRALAAHLNATFDGVQLPARDADLDHAVMNLRAAESGAPYAHVNLGRAYELGMGAPRDATRAYVWYALAALLGEDSTPLTALEARMAPPEIRLARRLALDAARERGLLRAEPSESDLVAADFASVLRRLSRPRAYLAGAWGFPDFPHDRPSYGRYVEAVKSVPFAPGAEMLRLIGDDLAARGYQTLNPWIHTFPAQLLGGALFGAGVGLDGRPWSEGSLAAGTLSRESLRHWLSVLSRDFRLSAAPLAPDASTAELEEAFRSGLGDMVYLGNKRHIAGADAVFVNLNAYRGDADDGTLWELIRAVETGKQVVVLVDENPAATLGEPIFGSRSYWNQMINGYLKEHADRVRIFHDVDSVLDYLEEAAPAIARAPEPPAAAPAAPRPRYEKLTGALAHYMTARGYARALAALDFARGCHRGRRKDGVTPELQHQVEIALYLTTLKDLPEEEQALTVALLHDVVEDYDIAPEEIERRFGADVARRVWLLTKTYRGEKKDPAAYFDAISRDPIASLVKGADRVHNLQSMVGVFPLDKQREYADEAERLFLPMLKDAERRFPHHGAAYRNIRHMIKSQLTLIRAAHASL
jgi:nucleoside 2-deoxyribosyltransferase